MAGKLESRIQIHGVVEAPAVELVEVGDCLVGQGGGCACPGPAVCGARQAFGHSGRSRWSNA